MQLRKLHAREVLDSRGNPTVEVEAYTTTQVARATVPSGASTGIHEALELRDGTKRYQGKGVQSAVKNINAKIKKALCRQSFKTLEELDHALLSLDGTQNKSKLGANAILPVSMAVARLFAKEHQQTLYEHLAAITGNKKLTLPVPMLNVINGGRHAENNLSVQEFMLVPKKAPSFAEALRYATETYHVLKDIVEKKYGGIATGVADEGGFEPPVKTVEEAVSLLTEAIQQAGYKRNLGIALDCAASEYYDQGTYTFDGVKYTSEQMVQYMCELVKKHDFLSIEDPFAEDDFTAYQQFMQQKSKKLLVVGDDLLVTNVSRIERAIDKQLCNALLLKINQIGTVSEALHAASLSKRHAWRTIVSHRSGDTTDDFIAELAVGLSASGIKSGAPRGSERLAKYNQLLRIEEYVGKKVKYARW